MKNKKAFTLIELLIVITITVILGVSSYIPYNHYLSKQKVRNSAKIISQTLYESRNLAINGASTSTGNLAVGVSFSGGNDYINIYNYPYTEKKNFNNFSQYLEQKYFSKKIKFEHEVKLTNNEKLLFVFNETSGSGIYYKNSSKINQKNIKIKLGYKGATIGNKIKTINYYTQTYITDIE